MIYPRLLIAKQLLKNDGIIFISIDNNEQSRLKMICDEIFGEQNFVGNIVWQKKNSGSGDDSKFIKNLSEYILVYSRNIQSLKMNQMPLDINDGTYKFKDDFFDTRGLYKLKQLDFSSLTWSSTLDAELYIDGKYWYPGGVNKEEWLNRKQRHSIKDWRWRWSPNKIKWGLENGCVIIKDNKLYTKQYQFVDNELNPIERTSPYSDLILNKDISGSTGTGELKDIFNGKKIFDHPKPIDLIKYLINLHTNKNALILDFFAGSGSTGHAVMDLNKEDNGNRKFILVQIPEKIDNSDFSNICEITKTRIQKAIEKYDYTNQGFKFFKICDTHFNEWKSKNIESYNQFKLQLNESVSKLEHNFNALELAYEIALKIGVQLDNNLIQKEFLEQKYYFVENNSIVFFFEPMNNQKFYSEIDKVIDEIYHEQTDKSAIMNIYLLDELFESQEQKLNCIEQINSISTQIKITVI